MKYFMVVSSMLLLAAFSAGQTFYDHCENTLLWTGDTAKVDTSNYKFEMSKASGGDSVVLTSVADFSVSGNLSISVEKLQYTPTNNTGSIQFGFGDGLAVGVDRYGTGSYVMFNGTKYTFAAYGQNSPIGDQGDLSLTLAYNAATKKLIIMQTTGQYRTPGGQIQGFPLWTDGPIVLMNYTFAEAFNYAAYGKFTIKVDCPTGGYYASIDEIQVDLEAPTSASLSINLAVGKDINKGLIGHHYWYLGSNELSAGATNRGVQGGSAASTYNWKDRSGTWNTNKTTLRFLKDARDYNFTPIMSINETGLGLYNFYQNFQYTSHDLNDLAIIAADWVYYTNYVLQKYRYDDTDFALPDEQLLAEVQWSPRVLQGFESPVPKVMYWQIGNEPGNVDNWWADGFDPNNFDFPTRYAVLSDAVLTEDPDVKVGGAVWDYPEILADQENQIDFITYHSYYLGYDRTMLKIGDIDLAESRMRDVGPFQKRIIRRIYNLLIENSRNPDNVELLFTEWNAMGFSPTEQNRDTMANMIATVETVFTWAGAEMNVFSGNYWMPPNNFNLLENSIYKVFSKLQEYWAGTLASSYSDGYNFRLYTTVDNKSGIVCLWGLNFSNDQNKTLNLSLSNVPNVFGRQIKIMTLGGTSLTSESFNWSTQDVTSTLNPANFQHTFPQASITLIAFDAPRCGTDANQQYLEADINRDCYVDFEDLIILVSQWLESSL